jgi:hypothetical protein
MDFVLRYRGPLPSTGSPRDKHHIRKAIHGQIEQLCKQEPLLEDATSDELPQGELKGRVVKVDRPLKIMYFYVALGGFQFVPIIHRAHELACALDILFLRREKPGAIIQHGGDLDNRLKTLFDALRMPHDVSELAGVVPDRPDQRMYCLLDDDSLITRVSVSTQQLLEPAAEGEELSTVELLIDVTVHSTYPMWANVGF